MTSFTIRVYGLCIEDGKVLVSDERAYGKYVTKFPGGGLHLGEGTVECLVREMMEETGEPIEVTDHYYTTDFFVQSAFNPELQVISIYYLFRFLKPVSFSVSDKKFDFDESKKEPQSFRWIAIASMEPDEFTLPVDRYVAGMLIAARA